MNVEAPHLSLPFIFSTSLHDITRHTSYVNLMQGRADFIVIHLRCVTYTVEKASSVSCCVWPWQQCDLGRLA
jgi:hypothetical protein